MSREETPFPSVWFPACSLPVFRARAGKFLPSLGSVLGIRVLLLRLPLVPANIDRAMPVPLIIPFRSVCLIWGCSRCSPKGCHLPEEWH